MSLSSGLSNAAYAVGTVLAVQFAQHLPQRRMMIGYAVLLVIGSMLAAAALVPGRECLVVCVWQTSDVGFVPTGRRHLNAAAADEVRQAAEETAAHGASLAEKAGFRPLSLAVEAAPSVAAATVAHSPVSVLVVHRRP